MTNNHKPDITNMSIEAQVVYAGHWQLMKKKEITFRRPWVISDKMKKGLDELVDAGYLLCKQSNGAVTYGPTDKMFNEKAYFNMEFLIEHGQFPIIDESKKK